MSAVESLVDVIFYGLIIVACISALLFALGAFVASLWWGKKK